MATVTFDTLSFVERLKAAGIPEAQAKVRRGARFEPRFALRFGTHRAQTDRARWGIQPHQVFMIGMLIGSVVALVLKSFF
jgi:hypothetical protein